MIVELDERQSGTQMKRDRRVGMWQKDSFVLLRPDINGDQTSGF